jgi:hypothetical protein
LDPVATALVAGTFGRQRDPNDYGTISIGVSNGVINQISTISALVTAMQPSVQSALL